MLGHAHMTPSSQIQICCLILCTNWLCGCVDHCIKDSSETQVAFLSYLGSTKRCLKPFNCDFYITLEKLQFGYCSNGGHLHCCLPFTVGNLYARADSTMGQCTIWRTKRQMARERGMIKPGIDRNILILKKQNC